uniref:WD repeat-containing protein 44 n=1 Tax=Physcomitrium patens TaxID=3218 RepID=A0A7I4F1N6_PHYPA
MGEDFVSDDEFHETFEDITSSSSSDSADEGNGRCVRMRAAGVAPAVGIDRPSIWTSSAFKSKFSVWKDVPGTINERRERFFKQMGLKGFRDDSTDAHDATLVGGFDSSEVGLKTSRTLREKVATGIRADEYVKLICEKCGSKRKGVLTQGNAHLESFRPEDSGIHAERALSSLSTENGFKTDSGIGHKGPQANHEKKVADTYSIAREGDSEPDSNPSGPRFSISPESIFQHVASSSQDKLFQFLDTDGEYEIGSPDSQNPVENLMEERFKIRDLDSGKQFLMKKFNRDGSLNMLREIGTGKDLTFAEFEKALGLISPVTQEMKRRQRVSDGQIRSKNPESKTDNKAPAVTKRKSWLRKLKGSMKRNSKGGLVKSTSARSVAVSDSVDDTDASSVAGSLSGDASPKRDSSFAGLDRGEFTKRGSLSGLPVDDIDDSIRRKPLKVKVRLRQKSSRDLSDLHLTQEILAHQGAIWTMKFSPDGRYLASAGQDRVIHVWEVVDSPMMAESDLWGGFGKSDRELGRMEDSLKSAKAGQDRNTTKNDNEGSTKCGKGTSRKQKSTNLSKGPVPKLFWLSEKPMCSFKGHTEDILDLSWSQSQFLLSSSMDKTVRLWHISYDECLRIFPHNDYVTCAQFNPLDDRYFLSGSLDDKVRIWSIPDHHVVDWSDLQEMVTAVCYTADGKRAIVGSYKGTCRFYNATGNKLQLEAHIDVREESKKARGKKITGLHCMPGDPKKVLVTSNDSRVRVYDGLNLVAKYKGLRNVKSQISSSFSPSGDFIVSASEDSRVLVWSSFNKDTSNKTSLYRRDKQLSCEEFTARHVSVAITWPDSSARSASEPLGRSDRFGSVQVASESESSPPKEESSMVAVKCTEDNSKCPSYCLGRSPLGIFGSGRKNSVAVADELTSTKQVECENLGKHGHQLDASPVDISAKVPVQSLSLENSPPHLQRRPSFFPEGGLRGTATWPEEKLDSLRMTRPNMTQAASITSNISTAEATPTRDLAPVSAAWGLVIVTAGLGGEITAFQNYGFPVRL